MRQVTPGVLLSLNMTAMLCLHDALLLCGERLRRHRTSVLILATSTGDAFPYMKKVHCSIQNKALPSLCNEKKKKLIIFKFFSGTKETNYDCTKSNELYFPRILERSLGLNSCSQQ